MKVYKASQEWTPHEEMQLQEIIEVEISKIIEIYRMAAMGGEDLENLTPEEIDELVDYIVSNYGLEDLLPNDEL